jgi:hypothetical protein
MREKKVQQSTFSYSGWTGHNQQQTTHPHAVHLLKSKILSKGEAGKHRKSSV